LLQLLEYNKKEELVNILNIKESWIKNIYKNKINLFEYPKLLNINEKSEEEEDLIQKANHYFLIKKYLTSYKITSKLIIKDPFNETVLPIHLCCLIELDKKSELFTIASNLIESNKQSALSWFSVGCYYYCIKKYDQSRKYFTKSIHYDEKFLPSYFGVGHSFSKIDETEQALSSYRSSFRLFPGVKQFLIKCYMGPLCIGIEYIRTNNIQLAEQFINLSMTICPFDPLIYNELGVISFKNKEYNLAIQYFQKSIDLLPNDDDEINNSHSISIFNIANCLRKLK
jgi:anaphase-promoting complex subunit 6